MLPLEFDTFDLASVDVSALAILLIFIPLFVILTVRAKSGRVFSLRSIPAYSRIRQLVSYAAESGRLIHVGMGSGLIGSESTAEALMGLTVFDYVARHAAASYQDVLGTAADGTILAAGQGLLLNARQEAGLPERYRGREVQFYGPEPLAYAAGVWAATRREPRLANVLLGHLGSEGLWISEATSGDGIAQVGGTGDPAAMALLQASLHDAVVGEEVFAAGAYLHRPSHLGSLICQDVIRIIVIAIIVIGVAMASLGYW